MKTKKPIKQIVTVTLAWAMLLLGSMFAVPQQVNAVASSVKFTGTPKDVTIKSSDTNGYLIHGLEGLTATCNVTVTTSDEKVVAFSNSDYATAEDDIVTTLSFIGSKQTLDRKGTWSTVQDIGDYDANMLGYYVAMGAGEAVITTTVTDTSDPTAEPLTQSFKVKVKKTTPKIQFGDNNNKKHVMWSDDEWLDISWDNITRNTKITIQCNKDNVFCNYFNKIRKIKKSGTVCEGDGICLKAKKAGKYKLKMTLTQDGESYTYPLTVIVKKYANPISNITINNKNYTKYFDKHPFIGPGANMGKGRSFNLFYEVKGSFKGSISLKEGYTLEGIYYGNKKIKTTKSGGKYNFTINATGDSATIYFYFKDSKGNRVKMWSSDL